MSFGYGKTELSKSFRVADFQHGLNDTARPSDVAKAASARYPRMQCVDCLNAVLDNMTRRKAVKALSSLAGRLRGMHFFTTISGTETLLIVLGSKLYSLNTSTGAITERFDFGGEGEAKFTDWLDKCWVTNGVKFAKVENDLTTYQVGIDAPTGVTAVAAAGGSLPDGVYKIFVSYGRDNNLYSRGQSVSDVTLGSGNNKITFSFPNSADLQVNNKIVWMTDAGGSVYYFYHETGDNTTTPFTVEDDSNKLVGTLYSVAAQGNYVPPAFEYVIAYDKRIWGSVDNYLYYSNQEGTVYDLEKFFTAAGSTDSKFIIYPFDIQGLFQLKDHLFLNTPEGIIRQPSDVFSRWDRVGSHQNNPQYFKPFETVVANINTVIGFTPTGFGVFNGEGWMENDYSRDIKKAVKRFRAGIGVLNKPSAAIVEKDNRTEYHVVFRDLTISNGMNNRRLVLNLSGLRTFDRELFIAPWELWSTGANYLAVNDANEMFCGQAHDITSIVYKDREDRMVDEGVYVGDKIKTTTPQWKVRSGTFVKDLSAIVTIENIRCEGLIKADINIRIQDPSIVSTSASDAIVSNVAGSRFGVARFGVDRFTANSETIKRVKITPFKGRAFYVEITQDDEDITMQLLELLLFGYTTKGRYI